MSSFFYRDGGRVIGPISGANLKDLCKRGRITRETEIRKDEGSWTKAGKVKGLGEHFPAEPVAVATKPPEKKMFTDSPPEWMSSPTPTVSPVEAPAGEAVIMRGRPSLWRGRPALAATLVSMPLVILLGWMLIPYPYAYILVVPLWVLWIARVCYALYYVYSFEYVITTERMSVKKGILTRSVVEVRHKDVRQLSVDQSLPQRVLGTGRIQVSSAAMSGAEIDIDGITGPDKIAAEIRKRQ